MELLNIHSGFLLLILISHPAVVSTGEQCSASLPTVRVVQTCPRNESELSHAQQQKKCEHLAKNQKCTTPAKFKYHCVLNAFLNETIEVCAPEIYSQGLCVKFDEGTLLQMFGENCTSYSHPCSTRFLSSDPLQYLQCNDLKQKRIDSTRTTVPSKFQNKSTRTTATPNQEMEKYINENFRIAVGSLCASVAVVLLFVIIFTARRYCNSAKKMMTETKSTIPDQETTEKKPIGSCAEHINKGKKKHKTLSNTPDSFHYRTMVESDSEESEKSDPDPLEGLQTKRNSTTILSGFNLQVFYDTMKKHDIGREILGKLEKNGVDCVATFCMLTDSDFETMGLSSKEREKCLQIVQDVQDIEYID